jgi:hypothetical protein
MLGLARAREIDNNAPMKTVNSTREAFMMHLLDERGEHDNALAGGPGEGAEKERGERHRSENSDGTDYPSFILHLRDTIQHRSRLKQSQGGRESAQEAGLPHHETIRIYGLRRDENEEDTIRACGRRPSGRLPDT